MLGNYTHARASFTRRSFPPDERRGTRLAPALRSRGFDVTARKRENVSPSVEAGRTVINPDFHAKIVAVGKYGDLHPFFDDIVRTT